MTTLVEMERIERDVNSVRNATPTSSRRHSDRSKEVKEGRRMTRYCVSFVRDKGKMFDERFNSLFGRNYKNVNMTNKNDERRGHTEEMVATSV